MLTLNFARFRMMTEEEGTLTVVMRNESGGVRPVYGVYVLEHPRKKSKMKSILICTFICVWIWIFVCSFKDNCILI